jgi:hypothetical protein
MINEDSTDFKESGLDGIISIPIKILCANLKDRQKMYVKF